MSDYHDQIVVKAKSGIIKRILNPFLSLLEKPLSMLPRDKRKLSLLIILLAIPITVGLVLIQQEIRSRAAGDRQLMMGMAMIQGTQSENELLIKSAIEEAADDMTRTGEPRKYPALFAIWMRFEAVGGPRSAFPSTDLLRYMDERGIAPVIYFEPVGQAIYSRRDGRIF